MTIEWESIDDELFAEAGEGACVQVKRDTDYMGEMESQNKKVLAYLQAKYPERQFRLSKWYPHDFGAYQEILERMVYNDDNDDDE